MVVIHILHPTPSVIVQIPAHSFHVAIHGVLKRSKWLMALCWSHTLHSWMETYTVRPAVELLTLLVATLPIAVVVVVEATVSSAIVIIIITTSLVPSTTMAKAMILLEHGWVEALLDWGTKGYLLE